MSFRRDTSYIGFGNNCRINSECVPRVWPGWCGRPHREQCLQRHRAALKIFFSYYDLQSVFFPATCIPARHRSSTAIWPVIPYLYSTMASSRSAQVIPYNHNKKKIIYNLYNYIYFTTDKSWKSSCIQSENLCIYYYYYYYYYIVMIR